MPRKCSSFLPIYAAFICFSLFFKYLIGPLAIYSGFKLLFNVSIWRTLTFHFIMFPIYCISSLLKSLGLCKLVKITTHFQSLLSGIFVWFLPLKIGSFVHYIFSQVTAGGKPVM
ncbi:unnamed protein product [Rangifer tarandus platyrhynchus]|uniref:Uncharacterized protein n=2 Tax=Rangifer tarandus platyrhynchus TaxID=3082113 RepID=A0AC59YIT9_RANTA|nr:unnamed protein product [Rangifer tarandus platyrhynchus]